MAILRIRRMHIKNFRCFHGISFNLGKVVTAIAGHNATGKSTILGLLGHCAELKMKDGRPILQRQFRTEFSEIIKASLEFDPASSHIYTIYLTQDEKDCLELAFRSTWQGNKTRFRIIPKKSPTRKGVGKMNWPTLYLGLSRLYPVGESEQPKTSDIRFTTEQRQRFFATHKSILTLNETPLDCSAITIQDAKKRTVGIKTSSYEPICNSAGQDNLSQILLAIMSFEALKEHRGEHWNGGLLLIDELDATLHPAAQIKLVRYLYRSAEELGIQVVFTTHSLSLLKFLCKRIAYNDQDGSNNYEIVYLTTRNEILEVFHQPSYEEVYYDMHNTMSILESPSQRVTIYTEDHEARWLLDKLVGDYASRIRMPEISIGANELLNLLKNDPIHFSSIMFVLDGDVSDTEIEKKLGDKWREKYMNVMRLPAGVGPERLIYEYLCSVPPESEVYEQVAATFTGFSKRSLIEHGPDSYLGCSEREQYKRWFHEFKPLLECVYPYLAQDMADVFDQFREQFIKAYNNVAPLIGASRIPETAMAKNQVV
jgi:predicted ATPase